MDPAPARYVIRINGHLGATVLSAFPDSPEENAVLSKSTSIFIVGPKHDVMTGIPAGEGAGSVSEDSSRAAWLSKRAHLRHADLGA